MRKTVRRGKKSARRTKSKMSKKAMRRSSKKKAKKSTKRKKVNKQSSWNVSSSKWSIVPGKKEKGSAKKSKKSKKSKKGPTAWNKHMMAVYKSMKAKNSEYKLQDAMKDAKKTYKK